MIEAWIAVVILTFVVLFIAFPWWAVLGGIYAISVGCTVAVWMAES